MTIIDIYGGNFLRKSGLDGLPSPRKIKIPLRQRSKTMEVARQHDPGITMKWHPRTHLTNCIAQKIDGGCGTLGTAIIEVDLQKTCAARNAMTPIISHIGNSAVKTKAEQ
jgi:hypothetical protein